MQSGRSTSKSTTRWWVAATITVVIAAAIGIALREQSCHRQRRNWVRSVQRAGVQTYPLSPLSNSSSSPSLTEVVVSLIEDGDLGVVIADDRDAARLIAHEGDCPRDTFLVIAARVSPENRAALAKRYPAARMTTFAEIYASNTPSGGWLSQK
jgi:hypothetical protein